MLDLTIQLKQSKLNYFFVKIAVSVTDWGYKVLLVSPLHPHDCSLQLIKRDYGVMVYYTMYCHSEIDDYRIEFTEYANVSV